MGIWNLLLGLEPLAEVQRALLVVEVFELPQPELGGLLGVGDGSEHCLSKRNDVSVWLSFDNARTLNETNLYKMVMAEGRQVNSSRRSANSKRRAELLTPFLELPYSEAKNLQKKNVRGTMSRTITVALAETVLLRPILK